MDRPRAFIEAPAGLASVSLRLHGGPNCRPPISRMGNKAGYAEAILGALGLRSGIGAGSYVWAESDPDVRALLRAYPDAAMLRRIAEIIRGWAGEEPRALWERLRAERKARGPAVDAEGAAGWMYDTANAHGGTGGWKVVPSTRPNTHANLSAGGLSDACHRLAEYATIQSSNRLVNMAGPDLMNTGNGGTRFGGEFATPAGDVAERFEEMAYGVAAAAAAAARTMPQAQARGATDGDFLPRVSPAGTVRYAPDAPASGMAALADAAERVAGWTQLGVWSYRQGDIESGGPVLPGDRRQDTTATATATATARLARGGWPPVLVLPTIPTAADVAAWLGTPGDLEGVVVYSDPPYVGTTGYRDDLPRADVVRHALDFAALGAVVCVSEAEALPELVAAGWHACEITGGRKGQKRTFSKQQGEWLTMNREPVHRVAVQTSMFAVGGAA